MDGARVVDEHVELVLGGAELAGEGADRIEVLQIGQAVADASAAGRRGDAAPDPHRPAAIPGQEVHRRAPTGKRDGCRVPDPGGRAGDEDGPPVESGVAVGGVLGQQPGPDGQADPGETRDDAGLQGDVHRRPEAGHGASPGRGAAPPDGTGVSGDVMVPGPRGRPGQGLGKPGSRPLRHGTETRPQDGVERLQRAPRPHLGLIADLRAILAAPVTTIRSVDRSAPLVAAGSTSWPGTPLMTS